MVLALNAGWLAAGLLAFTILFYALVYTVYLKPLTDQNIVLGGLSRRHAASDWMGCRLGFRVVASGFSGYLDFHVDAAAFLGSGSHASGGLCPREFSHASAHARYPDVVAPYFCLSRFAASRRSLAYFAGLGGVLYVAVSGVLGCIFVYLG